MGIFGGNYDRVGPGVSKSAPQKNRFFFFFEMLGRKFTKLVPLNLLYVITLIPLFLLIALTVRFHPGMYDANGDFAATNISSAPLFAINIFPSDPHFFVVVLLLVASVLLTGPATCGMTFVLRNMQREEHAWIFSDFKERFVKNFKQGVAMSAIDIFVPIILYNAFAFYTYEMPFAIGKYFIIFLAVMFIMMRYYIYTMIVTFDMKIKDILRNSVIFAIAKLPLNIFITFVILLILFLSIWYMMVGFILLILITLSLLGFFIVYSVYPTIEASMIDPQTPETSAEDRDDEKDFEDID